MAKVTIATMEKAAPAPPPPGTGETRSRALLSGAKQPIHLHVHELEPGATLALSADPADMALFVWRGAILAQGTVLAERASAVVERGACLRIEAEAGGATVLAFALSQPTTSPGGHVHILPRERVPQTEALGGNEGIGGALHADAQCPSCSVWLHENSYAQGGKETPVHSHSEDEVIFVHSGSVRLGNRLYGPGTALAVAANTKYGFFSGPDGLGFVNFRGASPTFTSGDGKTALDEAELWRGLLGRPEYIDAQP